MVTTPLGILRHACAILAGEQERLRFQNPERRCAGVGNAAGAPRGGACKEKNRLFFSKFYTAPPKVAFLIKQTQKGYLGLYLTASEQAIASQHGRSYHAVNERSALGFSPQGTQLGASPWQSVWGAAGRWGMAEPGAAALLLSSASAHLACPAPTSSRHSSCVLQPARREAGRHLAAPIPVWGMMLSPSPLALFFGARSRLGGREWGKGTACERGERCWDS